MNPVRILIVDDEEDMLEVCVDSLEEIENVEILSEKSSRRAAERLAEERVDILLTDIRMPEMDGIELLRHGREQDPDLSVLMMTAFPTVDTAIESMKLGAVDYVQKPFHPNDLLAAVRRMIEGRRLREENRMLQRQVERRYEFGAIVGESAAMMKVFDTIRRVAESEVDVLITGETGTGKELVARSIHENSRRAGGRFVPVDCGAIPANLLESEFFGYERGAFTGATSRNIGLMEYADGGTFFLDEIAELPLSLQAKLLRALQERRIRRVGGKAEIPVDVRVVAATAKNVDEAIREKSFREDLYFRINVVQIDLPSLSERGNDVELLIREFLRRYSAEFGSSVKEIDPEAMEILTRYRWPGNVRELQNAIRRGIALTKGTSITIDDLPEHIVMGATEGGDGGKDTAGFFDMREKKVASFERDYLTTLLTQHHGDVTSAAKNARMPRGTLYRLLNNHGIRAADYR
jgi:DNA-binding NtrC family response regulator